MPADCKPRDRRLRAGEENRLLTACREARNPHLLTIVQLALETAMRQGELIRLRREHIDLNRRTAHLPDTNNGEARTVPLSTTAVDVLRALPRSLHGDVFPGLTTEAIKRAYIRAVRRAAIGDLRFHNLRTLRQYTQLKAEDLAKKPG